MSSDVVDWTPRVSLFLETPQKIVTVFGNWIKTWSKRVISIFCRILPPLWLLPVFTPAEREMAMKKWKLFYFHILVCDMTMKKWKWNFFILVSFSPGARAKPVVVPPRDCRRQGHLRSSPLAGLQYLKLLTSGSGFGEIFFYSFIFYVWSCFAPWQTAQSSGRGSWLGCCWTASLRFRFSSMGIPAFTQVV